MHAVAGRAVYPSGMNIDRSPEGTGVTRGRLSGAWWWLLVVAPMAMATFAAFKGVIPPWTLTVASLGILVGDPRTAWPRLKQGLRQRSAVIPRLDPDYGRKR